MEGSFFAFSTQWHDFLSSSISASNYPVISGKIRVASLTRCDTLFLMTHQVKALVKYSWKCSYRTWAWVFYKFCCPKTDRLSHLSCAALVLSNMIHIYDQTSVGYWTSPSVCEDHRFSMGWGNIVTYQSLILLSDRENIKPALLFHNVEKAEPILSQKSPKW